MTSEDTRYPLRQTFEEKLTLENKSQATIESYTEIVTGFLRTANKLDAENIHDIEMNEIQTYLLSKKDKADQTRRLHSVALRQFLKYFNDQRYKEIAIPKKGKKIPKILSLEEIYRMINATKTVRDRAILSLFFTTGLRITELHNLTMKDIDFQRNLITVRNGKEAKDRQVVFTENAKQDLQHYLETHPHKEPTQPLFQSRSNEKLSKIQIYKIVRETGLKVGLKCSPHTLRHSFASLLVEKIPLPHLQQLLGHNDLKTTQQYIHISPTRTLEAYNNASSTLSPKNLCPKCNNTIDSSFLVCPQCGFHLKRLCQKCDKPMEESWRICPYCATKRNIVKP